MPVNKEAYIRYRVINRCLLNKHKKYPSLQEIKEECMRALGLTDLSDRTIEKDFEAMRNDEQLGYLAPIKYDPRMRGYYYADPNYSIDKLAINNEEIDSLMLAAEFLNYYKEIPQLEGMQSAIEKVLAAVEVTKSKDTNTHSLVHFDKSFSRSGGQHFHYFYEAIRNKKEVVLVYQKFGDSKEKEHKIEPKLLKEYKGIWYVLGYYSKTDDFITFALDRVLWVDLLDSDQKTDLFDEAQVYFKEIIGIHRPEKEPIDIVLTFTKKQGNYLKVQPIHSSQKLVSEENGKSTFSLRLKINHELLMDLASYGDSLLHVEPNELKSDLAKLTRGFR